MAGMYAKATGSAKGKAPVHHMGDPGRGILLGSAIVGASITVAVGAALAFKLQHEDNAVVDFFGDGASQRGDFHEGLNFAGVFKLPIVFVLENNQFAEMTPLKKHFAGSDFACRAQGWTAMMSSPCTRPCRPPWPVRAWARGRRFWNV